MVLQFVAVDIRQETFRGTNPAAAPPVGDVPFRPQMFDTPLLTSFTQGQLHQ
jgi:hypothetical protein